MRIVGGRNGFLVVEDCESKDEDPTQFEVYGDDYRGVKELLYRVIEYCGFNASRYDYYRFTVDVKHGDKYECDEKDCAICAEEDQNFKCSEASCSVHDK